jgi:sugar lactone lactonase YvrE
VTTYGGTATPGFKDGSAGIAQFNPGNSIVADAQGNLYVADAGNNRIRKISSNGQVTTIAGPAPFASPGGIAIDKQGNLYVADRGNFNIRKITAAGNVSLFAGSGVSGHKDGNAGEAQFSENLRDIAIDEQGNLYLSDGDMIRKITQQGIVSTIAGSSPGFSDGEGTLATFNFPNGLGIDAQGNIYVADLNNNRIRKISFE